jgi:hypothetical protein
LLLFYIAIDCVCWEFYIYLSTGCYTEINISHFPYQPDTPIEARDAVEEWYGKCHVLIFLSYTSDKLFCEANKQNQRIIWIYMED